MKKTLKTKVVVSAILAIVLCVSLVAGATYALFTSESSVNIAVTSGKVDVVATVSGLTLYSPTSIDKNGNVVDSTNAATATTFANGGTATVEDNAITLANITPGDKVSFSIDVANRSTVTIKYRTILACERNDGLFAGLKVTIDGNDYAGETRISDYATLAAGSGDYTIPVTIELPSTAGNVYQGKSIKLSYSVEAVQGNTETADPDENITYIYTINDLMALASDVRANNTYYGKTVMLMNDIDLAGSMFNGIGADNYGSFPSYFFNGTFDGQNYTIKNMTVSNLVGNTSIAGFFNGLGNNATVKNVKFDNAKVTSNHEAGVVAGYCVTADGTGVHAEPKAIIENCHVNNSVVTSVAHKLANGSYDDGDKVGGIIGLTNFDVKDCSVANTKITGVRDIGGIAGATKGTVTGCTIGENVSIVIDYSKIALGTNVNSVVGRNLGTGDITTGNSGTATITREARVYTASDLALIAANVNAGNTYKDVTVMLENDIDLENKKWIPIGVYTQPSAGGTLECRSFKGTFDGKNHTISNLKTSDRYTYKSGSTEMKIVAAPALFGATDDGAVIKNLTVKNALVWSNAQYGYASAVVGSHSSGTLTITNVSVEDSTICAGRYVGGFVGIANRADADATNRGHVVFTNCAMKNIEFYYVHHLGAESNVYGVLSNGSETGASGVTQTNITITHDKDLYYTFEAIINAD